MRKFLLIVFLVLATSCNEKDVVGIFFGQSCNVEERFKESAPKGFIKEIEASKDDYQVYVVTDLHIGDKTPRLDAFVEAFVSDKEAEPFCLCLGDLVKIKGRMKIAREAFQPIFDAGKQLFISIGNHDISFSQWEEYKGYFNTSVYQFTVLTPSQGKDLFICLDSAEGSLGRNQREWLEDILEDAVKESYRNIIVFTHTHFFKIDSSQEMSGNFNLEETYYLLDLFDRYGVDYVLTGHDHFYEKTVFRNVCYYTLNSLSETEKKGSYYVFTFGRSLSFKETVSF